MPYMQSIRNVQSMLNALYNGEEPVALKWGTGTTIPMLQYRARYRKLKSTEESTETETTDDATENEENTTEEGGTGGDTGDETETDG